MTVTAAHRLVRDESTNNLHLMKMVNGEIKALCNARYKVWDYGTIASDKHGENAWSWDACERCEKKADKGLLGDITESIPPLTVARAKDMNLDDSDGEFVVICNPHSTLVNVASQLFANMTSGIDFCDECRAERMASTD